MSGGVRFAWPLAPLNPGPFGPLFLLTPFLTFFDNCNILGIIVLSHLPGGRPFNLIYKEIRYASDDHQTDV